MTDFTVVLRGYDREQVHLAMAEYEAAAAAWLPQIRAETREKLQKTTFDVRMRGYDREQVDMAMRRMIDQLAQPGPEPTA